MIKIGLRRHLHALGNACPTCGQARHRFYRLHPFPVPTAYGKGMWLTQDCACIKAKQGENRKQLAKLLSPANPKNILPPALRTHTFANFKVDEFNKVAYRYCAQFVKNFGKNTKGQGLLLCGKSGRGKTHLACAIIHSLQEKYTVAFAHVPTLLERVRRGDVAVEQYISVDLFVLDDLGSERASDWALEKLLIIIEGRLNQFKPTVFTTNFNVDEIERRIGSRLASRILYNCLDVVIQGPDWREIQYRKSGAKNKKSMS